jgi:hypothetical protein
MPSRSYRNGVSVGVICCASQRRYQRVCSICRWSVPLVGFLTSAELRQIRSLSQGLRQKVYVATIRLQGTASGETLTTILDAVAGLLADIGAEIRADELPVSEKQEVANLLNRAQHSCLPNHLTKREELEKYRHLTT